MVDQPRLSGYSVTEGIEGMELGLVKNDDGRGIIDSGETFPATTVSPSSSSSSSTTIATTKLVNIRSEESDFATLTLQLSPQNLLQKNPSLLSHVDRDYVYNHDSSRKNLSVVVIPNGKHTCCKGSALLMIKGDVNGRIVKCVKIVVSGVERIKMKFDQSDLSLQSGQQKKNNHTQLLESHEMVATHAKEVVREEVSREIVLSRVLCACFVWMECVLFFLISSCINFSIDVNNAACFVRPG